MSVFIADANWTFVFCSSMGEIESLHYANNVQLWIRELEKGWDGV